MPAHRTCTQPDRAALADAPSLTLRASPGQGMHVHVARKRDASQLKGDKDFIQLSESGSTCVFFHKVG